jgi:DNA polymerase-3 subunit epsilon
MLYFCYDTETTGLVRQNLPASHTDQPFLVQLGAILANDTGQELASVDLIVRPDGWTIPKVASDIHGVTQERAEQCGVPLATALSAFTQLRANADEVVAYNITFDALVMEAAFARIGRKPSNPGPTKRTCAMMMALPVLNLPPTERMLRAGFNKPKPPNLTETHQFLFGCGFDGTHSAVVDARAALRCFIELRRRENETKAPLE